MKCDLRKVWIYIRSTSAVLTAVGVLALGGQFAQAQLEVTEIMYNPLDEDVWEWIEVRNTGGTDIDMAGWLAFNLGDGEITNPNPTIVSNTNSPNTIVPAGGVAVIYDGFHGGSSPGTFNDAPFRAAWGLDPSVPLMAGSFWPGLSNTEGSNFQSIGFWASLADYQADLVDDGSGNGTNEVGSFNNAQFSINYSDAAFPGPVNGSSMTWTGNGDNQVGGNWAVSQTGVNGATTSVEAQLVGTLNSTADIGNPGIVTASGAIPSALIISEIMYNAASNEPDWEWIEIYNNTGAAVDLSGYVLSDDDGGQLVTGNIASGTIAQGEAALFYDS
ncbi:MAG: lamin tail domain-containing protein, partial [Lacipirellulaceae bacterium]